jgi:hypothetical protein
MRRGLAVALILGGGLATPAAAADDGVVVNLRVPVPTLSINEVAGSEAAQDDGRWKIGGGTIGLDWRGLTAEGGTTFARWDRETRGRAWRDGFVRAGYLPGTLTAPEGRFNLVTLASYRYLALPATSTPTCPPRCRTPSRPPSTRSSRAAHPRRPPAALAAPPRRADNRRTAPAGGDTEMPWPTSGPRCAPSPSSRRCSRPGAARRPA